MMKQSKWPWNKRITRVTLLSVIKMYCPSDYQKVGGRGTGEVGDGDSGAHL